MPIESLMSLTGDISPVRIEVKSNPAYGVILSAFTGGTTFGGMSIQGGATYKALADEGYIQNSDAYACINLIANSCAGIGWKVYRGGKAARKAAADGRAVKSLKASGELQEVTEGPLNDLLTRPNPMQSMSAFIAQAVSYLYISGNNYIYRDGPKNKPPLEMWNQNPGNMKPLPGLNAMAPIKGYVFEKDGNKVEFLPDRRVNGQDWQTVLHLKRFHPLEEFIGLSAIRAASLAIDLSNAGMQWNVALLQNGCQIPGIFTFEGTLTPQQIQDIKDEIRRKYSGTGNVGAPALMSGGMKYEQTGSAPRDVDWIGGDELATRKTCAALGVAPELIGDSSNRTYSNYAEARKALYMETVLPLMDFIKGEFNAWLCPLFGADIVVDYDRDDIEAIQEDRKQIWDRALAALKAGGIMLDEYRAMIGLDPDPNGKGNVYYIPNTSTPVIDPSEEMETVPATTVPTVTRRPKREAA